CARHGYGGSSSDWYFDTW
nr:immunoglobulin heavy chain junction region [Macaca mulatta]MOW46227.1 immunoglobulin heavy chain junction region [Macaca mulatta]MOW46439.1 immunoglobulin heavy chain junction region [Macaca mulatta]MOW46587.1 immunoglobulin heavy chain junction region [Macaca mulatta]MOW47262.1 immunoglobulin heavy chain junction region [Macaca mulatta]